MSLPPAPASGEPEPDGERRPSHGRWLRRERALVVLIALHSYAVAVVLLLFTRWGAALGGWPELVPLFFARQAGIFHAVVATGYLLEYRRERGVTLLLVTKATAVLFLVAITLLNSVPWVVPASALGDGLMGLAVAWVRGRVRTRDPHRPAAATRAVGSSSS